MTQLEDDFSAYGRWRRQVADAVGRLRSWLRQSSIGDAQADQRLAEMLERLRDDKLTVAFVAEFSRGKSELINAIFFSSHGNRLLPSSTGRTTMCPTELSWQAGAQPSLQLLPIETRSRSETVSELKRQPEVWLNLPLTTDSVEALQAAFARVGEVKRSSQDEATALGFAIDPQGINGLRPDANGEVEIPCWRHAIIQFPHPLLEQGLVVLDTPGLNAIGAEPELTLSLLPNAQAILFILSVDTGVTQSDLTIWRDYVRSGSGARRRGRLVVLNKIDSLWDGLRNEAQIEHELQRQVDTVSHTLEIDPGQIYPVSAQKGLVSRVTHDAALLGRSRLPMLERALTEDLLPAKREIVADGVLAEIDEIVRQASQLIETRLTSVRDQLGELSDLRGKNQTVIEYMMRKIRSEKDEFEQGLQKYYAVRTVFTDLTNKLLAHLGLDTLREETRRTRETMLESTFTKGLSEAMQAFFVHLRDNLQASAAVITEITSMLEAMYKRFSVEHGLHLTPPVSFSLQRYEQEIDRLEQAFETQINTALTLFTTEKHALTQKFFETVALQARKTFEIANRDVEQWLRAVMAPLETQVREYQLQLKRRLDSVKRIHEATGSLEERVQELEDNQRALQAQLEELNACDQAIRLALGSQPNDPGWQQAA